MREDEVLKGDLEDFVTQVAKVGEKGFMSKVVSFAVLEESLGLLGTSGEGGGGTGTETGDTRTCSLPATLRQLSGGGDIELLEEDSSFKANFLRYLSRACSSSTAMFDDYIYMMIVTI
jgi:hypothetical protein